MSAESVKSYRFATDAQWAACLFDRVDREPRRSGEGVRPLAPYARPGTPYESGGGRAPVVTRAGEILWHDDQGTLYRLSAPEDRPDTCPAPAAIARAERILATRSGLWAIGPSPGSLERFDEPTLTRMLSVEVPDVRVVDIADPGDGTALALVEREAEWQCLRLHPSGQVIETIALEGIVQPRAIVALRRSQRIVVLGGHPHQRLDWYSMKGGPALFSIAVGAIRPCFQAHALGSDGLDRVLLAGAEDAEFGGQGYVVIFDGQGNPSGELPLDARDVPATGVTASREDVLVTGPGGLVRFRRTEQVPAGTGELRGRLITPVLFSRDREDRRRWLRIEAKANLPEGTTLEIGWAATDDADLRDRLNALQRDDSIPASLRIARLMGEPELQRGRASYRGTGAPDSPGVKIFSAKLFEVDARFVWVDVELTAASGSRLPLVSELAVLYPGRTLMEDLPAIYQKQEQESSGFLRSLVGVLEATTQGLDASIGSMGRQVHPSTAPERWLDFLARWLGVPWDDALSPEQKRAIMTRAPELLGGRGTRAGIEALLESLMPGPTRRFRVTDVIADFGFAVVGGESCPGSPLPAALGGHTPWHAALDAGAALGSMRLPCPGQRDEGTWQLAGKVRVDIAATAEERSAWAPWLPALVSAMVPLTARAELRWVSPQAMQTHRLDGTWTLGSAPAPDLGRGAVTGWARLPEGATYLSGTGQPLGSRLH